MRVVFHVIRISPTTAQKIQPRCKKTAPRRLKRRWTQHKELDDRRIIPDSQVVHASSASSQAVTHGYTRTLLSLTQLPMLYSLSDLVAYIQEIAACLRKYSEPLI